MLLHLKLVETREKKCKGGIRNVKEGKRVYKRVEKCKRGIRSVKEG